MSTLTIPYDPRWEAFCPSCLSLGTEYHPTTRRGRCHSCGFTWMFPPHKRLLYAKGWPLR